MQGIPEAAEVAVPAANYPSSQTTETGGVTAGAVPGAPNSSPLNMFPQVKIIIRMYHQKSLYLVITSFSVTVYALFEVETLSGDNFWCWSWNWIT